MAFILLQTALIPHIVILNRRRKAMHRQVREAEIAAVFQGEAINRHIRVETLLRS